MSIDNQRIQSGAGIQNSRVFNPPSRGGNSASGASVLNAALVMRGVEVDVLSEQAKSILSQYGNMIDSIAARKPQSVKQASVLVGRQGEKIQGVENLKSDSGQALDGFTPLKGPIQLSRSLNGDSYALQEVTIEELAERAFQKIAGIEANLGNALPTARGNGTSKGDFGAEVAARANGTLKGDGSRLRSAAEDDSVSVNGQKGEAVAVSGGVAAIYLIRVLAGIQALVIGGAAVAEAVRITKEKKKKHGGVDSDNGKKDMKVHLPTRFEQKFGPFGKDKATKLAKAAAQTAISEMKREGVPAKYAKLKRNGGAVNWFVTSAGGRNWTGHVNFNPDWVD